MAVPAGAHTFALEDGHDLLNKLAWEIDRLRREIDRFRSEPEPPEGTPKWYARIKREVEELSYGAFNCAVTAWAVSDWLYADTKFEHCAPTLGQFQRECRERCDALRFCYLIANGSKHGPLERNGLARKKEIEVAVEHDGKAWHITVTDAGQKHDAVDVFERALAFWDQMIRQEK